MSHLPNLVILFLDVILIDAQRINPEDPILISQSNVPKGTLEISRRIVLLVTDKNWQSNIRIPPGI
jgi:hypothetical protein